MKEGVVAARTFHAQDLAQWHLRTAPLEMSLVRCLAVAASATPHRRFVSCINVLSYQGICLCSARLGRQLTRSWRHSLPSTIGMAAAGLALRSCRAYKLYRIV